MTPHAWVAQEWRLGGRVRRCKELEAENARLKKMYAEERIKSELRQEALEGKM